METKESEMESHVSEAEVDHATNVAQLQAMDTVLRSKLQEVELKENSKRTEEMNVKETQRQANEDYADTLERLRNESDIRNATAKELTEKFRQFEIDHKERMLEEEYREGNLTEDHDARIKALEEQNKLCCYKWQKA